MQSRQPFKRSAKVTRVAAGVVIALAVLLGFALLTLLFGMVRGEEFSPSDFQRRSFVYFEIPWLGSQISPVFRDVLDNSLSKYLRKHELLIPFASDADRWDVVYRATSSRPRELGFAYNLCAYLDTRNEQGKPRWLRWTRDHPELAKVLWPAVATMAAEKLYFAIPEMMERARLDTSAKQLKSELEAIATHARQITRATNNPARSAQYG